MTALPLRKIEQSENMPERMSGGLMREFELLTSGPTAEQFGWLSWRGVPPLSAVLLAMRVARVRWHPRRRFDFDAEGVSAFVLPVVDLGEVVDVLAFDARRFALWEGALAVLGAETLFEPCPVFRHPLRWLASGLDGLVVVDEAAAWRTLALIQEFEPEDETHAEEIAPLRRPEIPDAAFIIARPEERAAA